MIFSDLFDLIIIFHPTGHKNSENNQPINDHQCPSVISASWFYFVGRCGPVCKEGGDLFLLFINGISLKKKLIGGTCSHEKIIRFYFLYAILKESIFFKKIS